MNLADFTTFDEVRAALGVSNDELEDSTLALEVYSANLEEDLFDVHPELVQSVTTIKVVPEPQRTALQSRFLRLVGLFSTYSVAKQAGVALPMFGPRSLGDGKATMSRFSSDPYKETLKRLEEQFNLTRKRLVAAFEALNAAQTVTAPRTFLSLSRPAYDPVTGEGS